jgi:2-alkyl-3-oxoalkanoate reductase
MKALVTGATGLIGSYTVESLLSHDHHVRILTRKTSDLGVIKNFPVEITYGDLRDPASLREAVAGVNVVFHSAARMSDWGDPKEFHADNIQGTQNLLEASLQAGVTRFIHVSSTGVLGLKAHKNAVEDEPYEGEGSYEETKVASEKLALDFYRKTGLPVTVIRPSWTLGPRARRHIPLLLNYLQRGILMGTGHGQNILTFVDPRDVADAMLLAAETPKAGGQIYHITNGETDNTQRRLYTILAKALQVAPPRIYVPFSVAMLMGWVMEKWAILFRWDDAPMCTPIRVKFLGRSRLYSCEKAKKELGYIPKYSLEQSLRDAVKWYQSGEEHKVAAIPALSFSNRG